MTEYTIQLNEKQMQILERAVEEWFRLRSGQDYTFSDDMAQMNVDLSPSNPKHRELFDAYIARRNHLNEIMRAYFRIAFEPEGYLKSRTDDMLIAEDIWDSVRFALGKSHGGAPLHVSEEPMPIITKGGEEK